MADELKGSPMSLHHMEITDRPDGKHGWQITVGDDIVATDHGQGYNNKQDALHSLFGIFLGTWDTSFLDLYEQWQSYEGTGYDLPEGAAEGVPVRIDEPMPEQFADASAVFSEATEGQLGSPAQGHGDHIHTGLGTDDTHGDINGGLT